MIATTPLVLLPGLLLDAGTWRHQIDDLAGVAEVSVGDLAGGETIAEIARAVLAAAPSRFALAGLSMGGYVALEIARAAPDRVSRLALFGTSARADSPERAVRRRDHLALCERGRFQGVTPRLLPFYLHPDNLDDEAITAPILAASKALGRDVFMRQTRAMLARADRRDALSAISCPRLVVCGRDDEVTPPENSLEIAAAITRADLVLLGRCGHLAPLERPAAVSAHLRQWLSR